MMFIAAFTFALCDALRIGGRQVNVALFKTIHVLRIGVAHALVVKVAGARVCCPHWQCAVLAVTAPPRLVKDPHPIHKCGRVK